MSELASGHPVCASCVHYVAEDEERGHCRRFPPTVFVVPTQNMLQQTGLAPVSFYPPTLAGHGCGEHPEFTSWMIATGKRGARLLPAA